MSCFWESLGERVGYGLASVVLGPAAARERRARRAMRSALVELCRPFQPLTLEAPKGTVRRSAQLPLLAGSLALEIELDLASRRVRLTAPLERLPSYVEARIAHALSALHGDLRLRLTAPKASSNGFSVWTESLGDDMATSLVEAVAGEPQDGTNAIELTLSPEHIDVLAVAPQSREEWTAIRDRVVRLAEWLAVQWPSSYRGATPR